MRLRSRAQLPVTDRPAVIGSAEAGRLRRELTAFLCGVCVKAIKAEVEVDAGLLGVFFMPPLVTATALEGDDLCNDLPRPGEEEEEVEDDLDFFMIIPYLYSKSGKDMLKWL